MIVKLSTGIEVDVQPVPPFALANVEARYPLPERDDPGYRDAYNARSVAIREAGWLMGLPNVAVPSEWRFPAGLQRFGLQARQGDEGRVLDYIEYALLPNNEDIERVQAVMHGGALTDEEVEAAVEKFRRYRRWETDLLHTEIGEPA